MSVLAGNTVDSSVFCFKFWQDIEYLDPDLKFPEFKWQNGRFVCIAWDHGDAFTYKIWTEPEKGGWKKGWELIRNAGWPRNESSTESSLTKEEYEELVLSRNTNLLPATEMAKLSRNVWLLMQTQQVLLLQQSTSIWTLLYQEWMMP
eukprot:9482144-Ditylum_brightwellii.AAC.1